MTTKKLLTGLIILSQIVFFSCSDWNDERIEGNDEVQTEIRTIASFIELESLGKFDVFISMADSTTLRIEAESNLLPYIETEVHGQKLTIEEKSGYDIDNNSPMRIYITTPGLEELVLAGSGTIECDSLSGNFFDIALIGSGTIEFNNLIVDEVEAFISGSGEIELNGEGKETDYEIEGSGDIRAIDFVHEDSESKIVGSGNIYVHATEKLKARIVGSGTIYYEGNPDIDESIAGSGDVRRY